MTRRKSPTRHKCSHSKSFGSLDFAVMCNTPAVRNLDVSQLLVACRYPAVQSLLSTSVWLETVDLLCKLDDSQCAIVVPISANDVGSNTQTIHFIERARGYQGTRSGETYPTYK